MITPGPRTAQPPPIRSPQIILGALALGVLTITGVAVFLRLGNLAPRSAEVARWMPLVVVGLAVLELPVYLLLRKTFRAQARVARTESLELVQQGRVPLPLQTLAILGAALAESVGLFGAVSLIVGASWFMLAAPLVAVALIVAQMPTRARLEQALRDPHE